MNLRDLPALISHLETLSLQWKELRNDCTNASRSMLSDPDDWGFSWGQPYLSDLEKSLGLLHETIEVGQVRRWCQSILDSVPPAFAKALASKLNGKALPDILTEGTLRIWNEFSSHVDRLILLQQTERADKWVLNRCHERGEARDSQERLDMQIDELKRMHTAIESIHVSYAAEANCKKGPDRLAEVRDLVLATIRNIDRALWRVSMAVNEIRQHQQFSADSFEESEADYATALNEAVVAFSMAKDMRFDVASANWLAAYNESRDEANQFEPELVWELSEVPEAVRPLYLAIQAAETWAELNVELHCRRKLGVFGPAEYWEVKLSTLNSKLHHRCESAIEEFVSNKSQIEWLVKESMLELGMVQDREAESGRSDFITLPADETTSHEPSLPITTESSTLPPAYTDAKMFERDRFIYAQRGAGSTNPEIVTQLARLSPEKGWAPLTTPKSVRDRLEIYCSAIGVDVPEGIKGNPKNIMKNKARQQIGSDSGSSNT